MSAIEAICELINDDDEEGRIVVDTILVPEQCALVYIEGKLYHITAQEVK